MCVTRTLKQIRDVRTREIPGLEMHETWDTQRLFSDAY
jgi:hypothetical protein